jgi:orsellinic acid C2-O-methyltransferase
MDDADARRALLQMIFGFFPAKAVNVAAELGLADRLAAGPRRSDDLAAETGTHPPSLYRLMRALAYLRVLDETGPGEFALGPFGGPLRSDAADSVHALALLFAGDTCWRPWGELAFSVRTGQPSFDEVFGVPAFEYMERDPELAAMFNRAMSEGTRQVAASVPQVFDFGRFSTVVDVGGGDGTLLAAVLSAEPGVSGVVFDLPAGSKEARARMEVAGVAERCEVVTGDFFSSVPEGADCYLMKSVIHDWDDDRCVTILRNCRRAMAPEGCVLVVEPILPARVEPSPALLGLLMSDLNMLACAGGRERTEDEFRTLFAAAGFTMGRVVDTPAPSIYSIIEGTPAVA